MKTRQTYKNSAHVVLAQPEANGRDNRWFDFGTFCNINRTMLLTILLGCSLLLTSCASEFNRGQSGAAIGAAGGALAGQAIGRDTEATLIGAAVGTVFGYIVGNEMDKYDRQRLNYAYERGISGQSTTWRNPDSGYSYSVTPRPATIRQNSTCRQAEIFAVIDGRRERTMTTACRDYNGQWILQ